MILTRENAEDARFALMDAGYGSYPAFDGTGIVIVTAGGARVVPWGDPVPHVEDQ